MQSDHAQPAPNGFVQAKLNQLPRQTPAPMLGVNIDVDNVAASVLDGVKRMRRRINQLHACSGNGVAVVLDDPAKVLAGGEPLRNPRLEVAGHLIEHAFLGPTHLGKHGAAMRGDQGGVLRCGCASLLHGTQYRV